jgi:hypothetical protein
MQTKIEIKGYPWTVKLLTPKQFVKEAEKVGMDPESDVAFTHKDGTREIVFKKGYLTPGTLRHELMHAIVSECRTDSVDLTPDQREELCCEILDHDWMMYLGLVEEILSAFC